MWWVSYVMIALPSGQALSVTKTCLVKQGGSSEYFFAVLYFILETLPPKPLTSIMLTYYVDISERRFLFNIFIHSQKIVFYAILFSNVARCITLFCRQILPGWQKMAGQVASSSSSSIFSSPSPSLHCLPARPAWPNTLPG